MWVKGELAAAQFEKRPGTFPPRSSSACFSLYESKSVVRFRRTTIQNTPHLTSAPLHPLGPLLCQLRRPFRGSFSRHLHLSQALQRAFFIPTNIRHHECYHPSPPRLLQLTPGLPRPPAFSLKWPLRYRSQSATEKTE